MIPAATNFDVAAMRLAVNEFDAEKPVKELDITDLDPGKIEMDHKWWHFKEAFLSMAKNLMGLDNDPLYYVIIPDQPAGWIPLNAFEQQMYQLPDTVA